MRHRIPTSRSSRAQSLMSIRNRALIAGTVLLAACTESVIPDYNNQTEAEFAVIQNQTQLQQLTVGILDVDRQVHDFQILFDETIARDIFRFDNPEPRYISEPLGPTEMSPTVFVGQSVFNGPYRAIRTAQNLITASEAAPDILPAGTENVEYGAEDKAATRGYAQTIKALSYMRLIEQRDTLGIAIYTTPTSLNPIECKENVLEYIAAVLDSGYEDLTAGAAEFRFDLPGGFEGFDSPETFAQFNRALKAKIAYYQAFDLYNRTGGADPGASTAGTIDAAAIAEGLEALGESFYNNGTSDELGVFHTYSAASGDYLNPNYNQAVYRINSRVVRESEGATFQRVGEDTLYYFVDTVAITLPNGTPSVRYDTTFTVPDQRIRNKVQLAYKASDCLALRDVQSCLIDKVNASNTHPLPIIRNDELGLIKAQLLWGSGQYQQALDIVNAFRGAAGLPGTLTLASFGDISSRAGREALMKEILRQKRNQLLFESAARFVDFRMFGFLADLGKERGNNPIPVFPFPNAEILARGGDTGQVCN